MSEEICLCCGKLETPFMSIGDTNRHMCSSCIKNHIDDQAYFVHKLAERIEKLESIIDKLSTDHGTPDPNH